MVAAVVDFCAVVVAVVSTEVVAVEVVRIVDSRRIRKSRVLEPSLVCLLQSQERDNIHQICILGDGHSYRNNQAAIVLHFLQSSSMSTDHHSRSAHDIKSTAASNGTKSQTGMRIGPYQLGKTLGVGSSGKVKLGVHSET